MLRPVFRALHLRHLALFATASPDPMRQAMRWPSFLSSRTDSKSWNDAKIEPNCRVGNSVPVRIVLPPVLPRGVGKRLDGIRRMNQTPNPGVHPNLFGQAARQAHRRRKSFHRLFSIHNLTATRALALAFDKQHRTLLNQENRDGPSYILCSRLRLQIRFGTALTIKMVRSIFATDASCVD